MDDLRAACAQVASEARWVQIVNEAIAAYSGSLPLQRITAPGPRLTGSDREHAAADTVALDAINFGSGWFPTLRKRAGRSGYGTVAEALAEHRRRNGPWTASTLATVSAPTIASILGQEAGHPLMALYAASLRDLGHHVTADHEGRFAAVVDAAGGSAVSLARRLGTWDCFADRARHRGLELSFLKRAQIAAADLQRAKVADWRDLSADDVRGQPRAARPAPGRGPALRSRARGPHRPRTAHPPWLARGDRDPRMRRARRRADRRRTP
ncbi:MAG: queuosine salvage family protein, partial [Actinomycetota bacterium]|nr:queuosine salvage family protein [Actinomycetota bacterium]